MFAIVLVASVGCASSPKSSHSAAHVDTWGDRLRAAIPPVDAPDHAQLLSAFDLLAHAIPAVAPGHEAEVDRVRNACNTLARSLGNLSARADFVKIGLVAVGDALEGDRRMLATIDSIDPSKPLRPQYDKVRKVLLATAKLMDRTPAPLTARR